MISRSLGVFSPLRGAHNLHSTLKIVNYCFDRLNTCCCTIVLILCIKSWPQYQTKTTAETHYVRIFGTGLDFRDISFSFPVQIEFSGWILLLTFILYACKFGSSLIHSVDFWFWSFSSFLSPNVILWLSVLEATRAGRGLLKLQLGPPNLILCCTCTFALGDYQSS